MHPAYQAFLQQAVSRKALLFGQLWITAERGKTFSIRHEQDRSAPAGSLKVHESPFDAAEIARLTADGKFRPLRSAATLLTGWIMPDLDAAAAVEGLEAFYPAAVVHWHQQATGTLHVRSYRETVGRQTGLYEATKKLTDRQVNEAIKRCCIDRKCLKQICWPIDESTQVGCDDPRSTIHDPRISCPEPCSLFMSEARRVLRLKPEPAAE